MDNVEIYYKNKKINLIPGYNYNNNINIEYYKNKYSIYYCNIIKFILLCEIFIDNNNINFNNYSDDIIIKKE